MESLQLFGIPTEEDMPQAFLTDHDVWDAYVGGVWEKLLRLTDIAADATVVEVGPGASGKVAYALQKRQFRGTLYVVDAHPQVLAAVSAKYSAILPEAKLCFISGTLAAVLDQLPATIDGLLASHVLDDMLIAASYAEKSRPEAVFDWSVDYTDTPSDLLHESWRELSGDKMWLETCKAQVLADWVEAIWHLKPRWLLLSQYPSSTLYDYGMDSLNTHAAELLELLRQCYTAGHIASERLQQALNENRHYQNHHIGTHVLNAKYWMLCQPTIDSRAFLY